MIELDDKATYEKVFHKALTSGVFQFESGGMRDVLRRYKPESIEDLTALNALYRPGPIQGGMIDDFIERKWGRRKVEYTLPQLEPLLKETLGVIVYQEQVMQIANVLASYSLGEADLLRRAMGKKDPNEMAKQRDRFMEGAAAWACRKNRQAKSSTRWRSSPDTASTSRTRRPMRCWPIRPPISRRTIRWSSWRRC
jgi:DNA polymerase-3 subunit alpha